MSRFRVILFSFWLAVWGITACNNATPVSIESIDESTDEPEAIVVEHVEATTIPILPNKIVSTATPPQVSSMATPTLPPTVTVAPLPTPVIYSIEEYDTLLSIAIDFEITVDDLLAANDLNEEDFLQIGQILLIPVAEQENVVQQEGVVLVDLSANAVEATTETTEGVEVKSQNTQTVVTNTETITSTAVVSNTAENIVEAGVVSEPTVSAVTLPVFADPPADIESRPANINPLTGLPVDDPTVLLRRPLMVRVGNDSAARTSQAGLSRADMVYEEITEWWVTRFTGIFLAETPQTVGPVRSARLINVQLVPQYQGALAHSGGSDPVRWEISQTSIVNLDEYYNPAPYYYRPNEGWQTRLAIDTAAARDYMVAEGTETTVLQHGFLFSKMIKGGEPAENIFIPYPRATTFTQWSYDPNSGKYLRWVNDEPLVDANVIVYFAEHQDTDIVEDANGATSIRTIVNGAGLAWFFRDGVLSKGYWQTDGTRPPYFMLEDGPPYRLKPGNTWVEVVPTYYTIGLNIAFQINILTRLAQSLRLGQSLMPTESKTLSERL